MLSENAGDDRCNDILRLGDDFGDNECSFACIREAGHDGPHRDEFEHERQPVVVTWYASDGAVLISDDEHLLLASQVKDVK